MGPFTVLASNISDYWEVRDEDGDLVADYVPASDIAKLFAAAPDLLLVCKCMAGDLQALLDGDDFSGMSDAEMFGVMLRSLNAAIAKAEGRGE